MLSICGVDCCEKCHRKEACGGCAQTGGHPFGGRCVAAEWMQMCGVDGFLQRKAALIGEFNALGIAGLHITDLNLLSGAFVNLLYRFPSGQSAQLLADNSIYWGNQIEIPGSDRCYGIVADDAHLLVCTYGCNGADPELILYRKR